ncbi:MAG: WXG100 family type VII secretion target [Gracilibacteraceae bacterium]|jgi:WXG100 family type VII secretion target|nr:WXG100 family type VII secretion target [Gracilibacteraceae bacterium]
MGDVRRLDTVNFDPTITAYASHIIKYEEIVRGMDSAVITLLQNWQGKGRNAFEEDSKQVRQNLQDIREIMENIRDALDNARNLYQEADTQLSQKFAGEEEG